MTIEYFNYRCNRKIALKEVLFQENKYFLRKNGNAHFSLFTLHCLQKVVLALLIFRTKIWGLNCRNNLSY